MHEGLPIDPSLEPTVRRIHVRALALQMRLDEQRQEQSQGHRRVLINDEPTEPASDIASGELHGSIVDCPDAIYEGGRMCKPPRGVLSNIRVVRL